MRYKVRRTRILSPLCPPRLPPALTIFSFAKAPYTISDLKVARRSDSIRPPNRCVFFFGPVFEEGVARLPAGAAAHMARGSWSRTAVAMAPLPVRRNPVRRPMTVAMMTPMMVLVIRVAPGDVLTPQASM